MNTKPKKIKLRTLINSKKILDRLYKTRLDGARALRLRKIIKRLAEEIKTFNEARNDYILGHGEKTKEGAKIEPNSPAFSDFLKFVQEMGEAEIDAPEPFFGEKELATLDLSAEDIDQIEALGLLKEDDDDGNK